jgi:hypothetical protein
MEQVVIFLIVAIFVGLRTLVEKMKGLDKGDASPAPPSARGMSSAPPQLTEADRRYREVQEEIRRRIAQRRQQAQTQPMSPVPARPAATPPPSPRPSTADDYSMSPPATPAAFPATSAMPVPVIASTLEAAATEAAAYALPAPIASDAPSKSTGETATLRGLRALLASPGAARQAYALREVLDRPLALRAAGRGGHESWS